MIGGHEAYSRFDPDKIFQEDGPDATVKNRFLNMKEFLANFPDALQWKGSRRKSSGPIAPLDAGPEQACEDDSTMHS